ncbi:MAG: cytochrome P460 family protein [Methylococcales bacterium]|jgi:hypothetical protein|nr:cytochrome P460 family protein [Methylococcales bacterium]
MNIIVILLLITPLFCYANNVDNLDAVDVNGVISLPDRYQTEFIFLGSWFLKIKEGKSNIMQNVYSRKQDVLSYKKNGQWPDGAILIKEQNEVIESDIGVALESYAGMRKGVFVMVKDRVGRFPNHPLWGNGWGWSFFSVDNQIKTTTKDSKKECIHCHLPVKESDYVFVKGYPILH